MSGFRCSGDDQFLDDIDLEEVAAMEAKEMSKLNSTVSTTANTTANSNSTNDVDGFEDDDDDEILIIGEKLCAQANLNTSVSSTRSDFFGKKDVIKTREPVVKVATQPQPPKSENIAVKTHVFEGKDDDWEGFTGWFENQEIFDTPWFRTIPITRLNISQCESIVSSCSDLGHLVQFAKLLVSFLKDGVDDKGGGNGNVRDISGVIEKLFVRLEDYRLKCSPELNSQANDLHAVCEDILDVYISGKYNFTGTRIPELLINLYPKSFEDIMCRALKREQVDLLLPICERSTGNFLKIMQCLHSSDICSKAGIESDPDFHAYKSNPTQKLAVKLLKSLQEKLGTRFLQILPAQFQCIFSFDFVISKNANKYRDCEKIISETFSILNDLFCGCARENWKACDYIKFILSLLPFTSTILKDGKLIEKVEFKKYPYLYLYLKRSRQ